MCCRYFIDDHADELLPYFEAAEKSPLTEKLVAKLGRPLRIRGEVRPTDLAAALARSKQGGTAAFPMIWGYSVEGAKGPVFNARSETAGERPMFRDGWASRRCVIPASGFYEWGPGADETKTKYAIQPMGAAVTFLAGIYRFEERRGVRYPAFTILTREALGGMTAIHDRMPVILAREQIADWLDPAADPATVVRHAIRDLTLEEAAG